MSRLDSSPFTLAGIQLVRICKSTAFKSGIDFFFNIPNLFWLAKK